jgi:serine/arginine repetitive matrix protein 2
MARTKSQRGSQSASQSQATSSALTSWRSKAAPLPPIVPRRFSSSHSPVTPLVSFPSASQVLDAQLLSPGNDESLEEVEFTDLGKFVGVESKPEETVIPPSPQEDAPSEVPNDDQPAPIRSRSDLEPSWRRKTPLAPVEEQPTVITHAAPDATAESLPTRDADIVPTSPSVRTASTSFGSPVKPLAEGALSSQTLTVPSSLSSQRSPRTPSSREELRSTFDDTMSRIKGAMQTKSQWNALGTEHHTDRIATNSIVCFAEQPRFGRGVPPAPQLHPTRVPDPEEPFATMSELDHGVQKGQSHRVRLPSALPVLEPLSKRELANLKRTVPPLRWEVVSWDPPVEGMSLRDYSVNAALFRKPPPFKGRPRFFVKLPTSGSYLIRRSSPTTPKVHLPAKSFVNKTVATTGAFGRPRVADDYSNWRRTLPPIPDQLESTPSSEGLVTRSGSSPPDIDKASDTTPTAETETSTVQLPTRPRAEPKMPAGAGVAFYRESKSFPSVNFTVSSELEDVQQSEVFETPLPAEESAPTSQVLDVSQGNEASGPSPLPAPRTKAESKSSDGSVSSLTMLPRCI